MTSNKFLFLIGALIAIIVAGYLGYTKYNQYLPSTDVIHAPKLDQTAIHQIRFNTPITEVHVYKAQRMLELRHDE